MFNFKKRKKEITEDDFVKCAECGWKILKENTVKGGGETRQLEVFNGYGYRVRGDYIQYPWYCRGKCEPKKRKK